MELGRAVLKQSVAAPEVLMAARVLGKDQGLVQAQAGAPTKVHSGFIEGHLVPTLKPVNQCLT